MSEIASEKTALDRKREDSYDQFSFVKALCCTVSTTRDTLTYAVSDEL